MPDLEALRDAHWAAPFPPEARGKEVAGEDLVLLDMYTAGCIDTYIGWRGYRTRLDARRLGILQDCVRALATVVPQLEGEAQRHFDRLWHLGAAVLQDLASRNPSELLPPPRPMRD